MTSSVKGRHRVATPDLCKFRHLKSVFSTSTDTFNTVTRSHKLNDRDHAGLADGSAAPAEHLPRYFGKAGHADSDPKKTKKNGSGKGNWQVIPPFYS